jgi:hypothetical protein
MNETKRVPAYTRKQTIVFPVDGDRYAIETLCGDHADVETIEFRFESKRGDDEATLDKIVLGCLTLEGCVEYVHTIRMRDGIVVMSRRFTGYGWLDRLTAEAIRIAADDGDAW